MAAGEADFLLDVRRPEHLRVDHRVGNIGTEARQRFQCQGAYFLAPLIPAAARKLYGTYCAKTLMVCSPAGTTDLSCTL